MNDYKNFKFPIIEIFRSVQGEGPDIGKPCIFVRFANCDFDCMWCDTKYSWDRTHKQFGYDSMTAGEIMSKCLELDAYCQEIVFTGGNPALQPEGPMNVLISALRNVYRPIKLCLETQGSIWKNWFRELDLIVLSPKLPNAQVKNSQTRQLADIGTIFSNLPDRFVFKWKTTPKVALKIVCFVESDILFAETYLEEDLPFDDITIQVGTLSSDTTQDILDRTSSLIDAVYKYGHQQVRVLPQLHTLLWGSPETFNAKTGL